MRKGLKKGDRLCVYLVNCVEMIDIYLACVKLGVIFVPINILYRDREISHLMRGQVDSMEADQLLADHGHGNLRLVDNGVIAPRPKFDGRPHAFHLLPAQASKAAAVALHMQARGYAPEECIAVGDSVEGGRVLLDLLDPCRGRHDVEVRAANQQIQGQRQADRGAVCRNEPAYNLVNAQSARTARTARPSAVTYLLHHMRVF